MLPVKPGYLGNKEANISKLGDGSVGLLITEEGKRILYGMMWIVSGFC